MKTISQVEINGEKYKIGPVGHQVSFKYVTRDRIPQFLAMNPMRGELFIDDTGTIYIVDKGELDLYLLRLGQGEVQKQKIEKNPFEEEASEGFLDNITFDLF